MKPRILVSLVAALFAIGFVWSTCKLCGPRIPVGRHHRIEDALGETCEVSSHRVSHQRIVSPG